MIVKYINEDAFGKYKDHNSSRQDKMNNIKKMTTKILDDIFNLIDVENKVAIENILNKCWKGKLINKNWNGDLLLMNCRLSTLDDYGVFYDEFFDKEGVQHQVSFITKYEVNETKDLLKVRIQVPVFIPDAYDDHSLPLDDIVYGVSKRSHIQVKPDDILKTTQDVLYDFCRENIGEKLCEWFDVKDVKWVIKFHLVDKIASKILENKNITYEFAKIGKCSIGYFLKRVIPCFEWFHIKTPLIICSYKNGYTQKEIDVLKKYVEFDTIQTLANYT